MIYTVTLNPSIDYIVRIDDIELGNVNRMSQDYKYVGGKGINVSRILRNLGFDNIALGFVGGFTGKFIEDKLREDLIKTNFVIVDDDTRINVKIKSNYETEINARGPYVTEKNVEELINILKTLRKDDVVVFAGSAPNNLGNAIYERLIPIAKNSGAEVVCDFEGETLIKCLDYEPLLVKPNKHELEAIFNTKINNNDVLKYAREILNKGAKNVIVSMAKDGAMYVNRKKAYISKLISGKVKNSVGAGDSMVAGFTGQITKCGDFIEAFKWGIACGTATAFSDDLASKDKIKEIYNIVEVYEYENSRTFE